MKSAIITATCTVFVYLECPHCKANHGLYALSEKSEPKTFFKCRHAFALPTLRQNCTEADELAEVA